MPPSPPSRALRVKHFVPLLSYLIPSAIIGFGFVLPRAGMGGVNDLSIGFVATLIGAAITYAIGIRTALRS